MYIVNDDEYKTYELQKEMLKISNGSKFRVLFWCLMIAIVVYIIADVDRHRKDETEETSINIEETLSSREDFDVIKNKIIEVEYQGKEKSLQDYRVKLEEERVAAIKQKEQEEIRLAKIAEQAKKEKVIASNDTPTRSNDNRRLLGTFQATAYTDNIQSQGRWVGQTATGVKPQVGLVAVDPKVIPLGTKLYIEGYGNATAGDTGGAIKGNRVDLFRNTQKECMDFGRQNVKIWVIN